MSTGELRAFVATRLGGHSWVVDLVPNYELTIGSDSKADIRIEVPDVKRNHATLRWNGEHILLTCADGSGVEVNGRPIAGTDRVTPGDEIRIGPAIVQVNITLAPTRKGRRSLTHHRVRRARDRRALALDAHRALDLPRDAQVEER